MIREKMEEIKDKQKVLHELESVVKEKLQDRNKVAEELKTLKEQAKDMRFIALVEAIRDNPRLIDILIPRHSYTSKGCNDSHFSNYQRCLRCNLLYNLGKAHCETIDDMTDFFLQCVDH